MAGAQEVESWLDRPGRAAQAGKECRGLSLGLDLCSEKMSPVAKGNWMPCPQPCPSWVPSIPSPLCFSDISHLWLGAFYAGLVSTFCGICISAPRYMCAV